MNVDALLAVIGFAAVVFAVFGALYVGASQSYRRGEIGVEALRLLRWAFAGFLVIYLLLAVTSFLT